jgi:hypothetical protein
MDDKALKIEELIKHILEAPNKEHTKKSFKIGKHSSEYKAINTKKIKPKEHKPKEHKPKEHKLWIPSKTNQTRCFLIIQLSNETLKIHQLLAHPDILLNKESYYNHLIFCQPSTYAAKYGEEKQFKKAIKIDLAKLGDKDTCVAKIRQLIIRIADETVSKKLNLRHNTKKSVNIIK